jgi:hypothetical protein
MFSVGIPDLNTCKPGGRQTADQEHPVFERMVNEPDKFSGMVLHANKATNYFCATNNLHILATDQLHINQKAYEAGRISGYCRPYAKSYSYIDSFSVNDPKCPGRTF